MNMPKKAGLGLLTAALAGTAMLAVPAAASGATFQAAHTQAVGTVHPDDCVGADGMSGPCQKI